MTARETWDARNIFLKRLKEHEGCSLEPYTDTEGHLTIGYGHKLDRITQSQAEILLAEDIVEAEAAARDLESQFRVQLSATRHFVIVEMCFQMGEQGVRRFLRMWTFLAANDYHHAAEEMLDSKWARQTPNRAKTLAQIMQNDER